MLSKTARRCCAGTNGRGTPARPYAAGGQGGAVAPPEIFEAKKKKKNTLRFYIFKYFYQFNNQKIMQLQVKLINQRIVHGHSPFYVERHTCIFLG